MGTHQLNSLIKMINQISENHPAPDSETAAQLVSVHVQKFWSRSMKEQIQTYNSDDGALLTPIAKEAISQL